MIYTFYSFEHKAGRSMSLANVADLFYQKGLMRSTYRLIESRTICSMSMATLRMAANSISCPRGQRGMPLGIVSTST